MTDIDADRPVPPESMSTELRWQRTTLKTYGSFAVLAILVVLLWVSTLPFVGSRGAYHETLRVVIFLLSAAAIIIAAFPATSYALVEPEGKGARRRFAAFAAALATTALLAPGAEVPAST